MAKDLAGQSTPNWDRVRDLLEKSLESQPGDEDLRRDVVIVYCNSIWEEIEKRRRNWLDRALEKAIRVERIVKGLKIHYEENAKKVAGIFNTIGVESANKGKHWRALRILKKAKRYDSTNDVIRKNVKAVRANIWSKFLIPNLILARIGYLRAVLCGALIGVAMGSIVFALASYYHIYVDIMLSGLLSGAILLTLAFVVLPLWLFGSTQAYTSIVGTLWRWFRGGPIVASLLALAILPFGWAICVPLSWFGVVNTTDIRNSFTKAILSLGIRTIPISWFPLLYLWLVLSIASIIAFGGKTALQLSNLTVSVILVVAGMYTGLILALMLFRHEEDEETTSSYFRRKVLKFHSLYPESHLTYILLGGLAGISPWLWEQLSEWLPIHEFLFGSGELLKLPNVLVAGGIVGILYAIVFQFMVIKMCKK